EQDLALAESIEYAERARRLALELLAVQLPHQPLPLILRQPARLVRPVGQIEERDDAEDDCRYAFEDEDPAPACHSPPVDAVEDEARDRRADQIRDRERRHKERDRFSAILIA